VWLLNENNSFSLSLSLPFSTETPSILTCSCSADKISINLISWCRIAGSTIESESNAWPIAERGERERSRIYGSEASRRSAERVSHLNTGSRGFPVTIKRREKERERKSERAGDRASLPEHRNRKGAESTRVRADFIRWWDRSGSLTLPMLLLDVCARQNALFSWYHNYEQRRNLKYVLHIKHSRWIYECWNLEMHWMRNIQAAFAMTQ